MTELVLRAREKIDAAAIAAVMNLPGVRFETLRTSFISTAFAENWGMGRDQKTILAVRSETSLASRC
jgi:hypothetical protein